MIFLKKIFFYELKFMGVGHGECLSVGLWIGQGFVVNLLRFGWLERLKFKKGD